ncbi:STAS domain-containing protein [Streptomyces xanthophaeus]
MGSDPEGGSPMCDTFDVDVRVRPDRVVVTMAGELDLDTCSCVTEAVAALALEGRLLAVDLSGLSFMDSMGLNMLLGLRERARTEGWSLELCGVPAQALRVFDLTETRRLFVITPRLPPERLGAAQAVVQVQVSWPRLGVCGSI